MSFTEVDRLESALLMLLRANDTSQQASHDDDYLANRPSLSGFNTGKQSRTVRPTYLPLSSSLSLPVFNAHPVLSSPWSRSSVDGVITSAPATPHAPRMNSDRGGATATSTRYKTELCRAFAEHGSCRYGDKCQFAHGRDDLRAVQRHPKYKTDLCRTYHTTGLCPYGARCHFIHNEDEIRCRQVRASVSERPQQRHVDLAASDSELRLALLLNCYQRQLAESPSSITTAQSYLPVDQQCECSHTGAMPAPDTWRFTTRQPDLSSSVSLQTANRSPSSFISALPLFAGTTDSVGNSPSPPSSFVDDYDTSSPPLSPAQPAEDACRQLLQPLVTATNDRLNALLILAARLRLLTKQ